MALVTANDLAVLDATICLPRTGAWTADLKVDSPDALAGRVTISIDDGRLTLVGTAFRTGAFVDTAYVRVVGGAGGLRALARARHYNGTNLRIVLRDLLAAGGETLSATADGSTLAKALPAWTTSAISVGRMIARAIESAAPGASWRILPDGTLWVGPETWLDSGLAADSYQVMDEDPRRGEALLGVEAPLLLPGTTLGDRRVSYVEHRVGDAGVRSVAWFEDAGASGPDRLRAAIAGAVAGAIQPLLFHSHHYARVVAQAGATIDVEIENPTIAKFLPSMASVPLLMPFAGAEVAMLAAGRVLIGWSGGDPSKPYAMMNDPDTQASAITLNADLVTAGGKLGAQFAALGEALQAYLNTIGPLIANHGHPVSGAVAGLSPTLATVANVPNVTASKVKVS